MFHWHICCYVPRRIYNAYNLLILFQAFLLEIQTCVSYVYFFFQLFPPELSSLPRSDCSLIFSNIRSDSPAVLANEYNTISTIIINAMLNANHVGTRQSSRLLYRPVYKEVFSPPGVTDEPQNVFHDALLNYQKHYLLF